LTIPLTALLDLTGLRLRNKAVYRRALDRYAGTSLDFADCVIVGQLEHAHLTHLVSCDTGFDQVPGITRTEP
jgi:predicted nucleic-acid-binding protein